MSRKKERFIWYATHWLTKLDRLKLPVETVTPLFQKIFTRAYTVRRHTTAALLEERLMYLQHWYDVGAATLTLGTLAQYLLIIIQYLNFYQVRIVTLEEIEKAANCWEQDTQNIYRKNKPSQSAKKRFIRDAVKWFNMLGCLQKQPKEPIPFEEYLNGYISYMRYEQGLSEQTILARFFQLRRFLADTAQYQQEFIKLTPRIVDEIITSKYDTGHYSRRTVQSDASTLRSFLRYAENQGWCPKHLASTIKAPRVYRDESLPSAPSWSDVQTLLAKTLSNNKPIDIRDYAVLMLLSVYGMRSGEVTHMCLEDIDWTNELIHFRRSKRCNSQTFPLSKTVGEAILRYLTTVRPQSCSLRAVFLCMRAPYRSIPPLLFILLLTADLRP